MKENILAMSVRAVLHKVIDVFTDGTPYRISIFVVWIPTPST